MEEIPKQDMIESSSIKTSVVDLSLTNPCSLFQEAFRALLKCLGFEDSSSSASDTDHPAPTTEDDPPTSTSVVDAATTLKATNPRPPIKPGRGPQTNSTPSS